MESEFAIVEQMGHVRFGARVTEVEKFGIKMLRAELITRDVARDGAVVTFVHPQTLYRITPCTEAEARAHTTPYTMEGIRPALPATVTVEEEADEEPRHGGPEKCPHPCVECPEGDHHFCDVVVEFADGQPEHEAARAGIEAWLVCKHCNAWREFDLESDEEPAEDDEPDRYCVDCQSDPCDCEPL